MLKRQGLLCSLIVSVFFAEAQFCNPDYTIGTTDNDYIDGFELNTISNIVSGGGDGTGYTDFTALSTYLEPSEIYLIHIVNTPFFTEAYRCWIDYNHDGVFTVDEELFTTFFLGSDDEAEINFSVPPDAMPGYTRLRIRCVYGTSDFDACSEETYGEAEDYSVYIGGFEHDLSVLSIVEITDACEFDSGEPITINIKNFGTNIEADFNIHYSVDGATIYTETFPGTILPGEISTYTFDTEADISADGIHNIYSWVTLPGDEFPDNDSLFIEVENTSTFFTTGFPLNICYNGETILPIPLAAGGTWSGEGIVNEITGELDPSLMGGIGSSTEITYSFIPDNEYTVSEIPYSPYPLFSPTSVLLGDDESENNIDIGFEFLFFDEVFELLFISSNGFIGFSEPSNSYTIQHFPSPTYPNNIIAFAWTDLNPSDGGEIRYEIQGTAPFRRFVLDLQEVAFYASPETLTLQMVLYETSNAIDFHVYEIQSDGDDMTQGIENENGTIAFVTDEIYNKQPFTMTEMGWRFAVTPCAATVTQTISFIEPPTVELDSAYVCEGTLVTLDAGPDAESYLWSTGESTQTIDITTSGDYWVIYFSNISCYAEDTTTVTINPLPVLDLGPDGIICEGTMLDAENPGALYTWSTGATTQTLFITESGNYDVSVLNPITGCENSDTINVSIIPLPVATFIETYIIDLTYTFNSTSIGATTWLWDFGDGSFSFEENPTHTFPFPDEWNVTLVVSNDCGADIESTSLQIATSIKNNINSENIFVYPNPASDYVIINFKEFIASGNIEIYLYTLQGKLFLQQNIIAQPLNTFKLNTENLSAGDFMLVVKQEKNVFCLPLIITK